MDGMLLHDVPDPELRPEDRAEEQQDEEKAEDRHGRYLGAKARPVNRYSSAAKAGG
jgi:hypothetical protein